MHRTVLVMTAALVVSVASAQTPTPAPEPTPEPGQAVPVEVEHEAAPVKPFKLFDSIAVVAKAPPPEVAEVLRGQLQLMTSLRRGWYTGPAISGPIFEAWNAADYTPAASNTYYGVPYYMRSGADYYFGAPAGVGQQYSFGEALGAALIQAVAINASHHY